MLALFKKEPIVIKGCLSFSLKDVAKALFKHGLIRVIWDTNSNCLDGADAAWGIQRAANEAKRRGQRLSAIRLIQEIIKYNEVACQVLQEIHYYLLANHVETRRPFIESRDSAEIMLADVDTDDDNEVVNFSDDSSDTDF